VTSTSLQHQDRTYLQRFGLNLKVLRVKSGLSQEELAGRAGLHRTFIGLLERGQSGVSIERLPDLAEALGVEPAELLPPWSRP
jgi:transcriptional regulator with XRE-family HTH domain